MELGGERLECEGRCMRNVSGGAVENVEKESPRMVVRK
jgi:hypothetical protein